MDRRDIMKPRVMLVDIGHNIFTGNQSSGNMITTTAAYTTSEPNDSSVITQDLYRPLHTDTAFVLSHAWVIASTACLSIIGGVSLITNVFLIVIIFSSPNLKTPPNSHLINICINDLLLCVGMVLSICSLNLQLHRTILRTLGFMQGLLSTNTFVQYALTFAAISFFRYKTLSCPTTSLRMRKLIVHSSIIMSWIMSATISIAYNAIFFGAMENPHLVIHPYITRFHAHSSDINTTGQIMFVYILFFIFIITISFVIGTYYRICKKLGSINSVGRNRVSPWQRTGSVSSEVNGPDSANNKTYADNTTWMRPFIVSEHFAIQYHRGDNFVTIDDIFALEYPRLAMHKHRLGQLPTTPNVTTPASTRAASLDFTDITPLGELQRFQRIKNSSALKMQSLRNDRENFVVAMRNTLIMFSAFLFFSVALLVCNIPSVLSRSDTDHRVKILIISHILFCMNTVVYPVWFLTFSKRVKKCIRKMVNNILVELTIRT